MTATQTNHIHLDERGVAWVDDSGYKVAEVVNDRLTHGLSPEEIVFEHYNALTLAQVYAALAYYYDHKEAIDGETARQSKEYEALRAQSLERPRTCARP